MNKTEIKNVMFFARQAIVRVYGRQPLKLVGYNILSSKNYFPYIGDNKNHMPTSIWIEIVSEKGTHYKAKIEQGWVVALAEGRLNV